MSAPREGRVLVAAAVAWRDGRVLLTQRPPGGAFALQWEFPGGKLESGESAQSALEREIHEELGVGAACGRVLGTSRHDYASGLRVEVTFIECALESLEFRPGSAVHALRWARPSEIDPAELLEADREFVRKLAAGKAGAGRAIDPAGG